MRSSSAGCEGAYHAWRASLPCSASEVRFRGGGPGVHWLRSGGLALRLVCVFPEESEAASELAGTRWNFCGVRSDQGGAGSAWHWMVTQELTLLPDGVIEWCNVAALASGVGAWGRWRMTLTGLELEFNGQCLELEANSRKDELAGQACFLRRQGR